jgi:hypothetical protein
MYVPRVMVDLQSLRIFWRLPREKCCAVQLPERMLRPLTQPERESGILAARMEGWLCSIEKKNSFALAGARY